MIATKQLKCQSTIQQTNTYICNAAQAITESLKLLVDNNPHIIRNTQGFPSIIKARLPLETNKENFSYDLEYDMIHQYTGKRDNLLNPY